MHYEYYNTHEWVGSKTDLKMVLQKKQTKSQILPPSPLEINCNTGSIGKMYIYDLAKLLTIKSTI